MTSTPVAVKFIFLLLFIYWISCITCYSCADWQTVDGCNDYEASFWAQTFTDNTPAISSFSSFKEITVEGQYGQVTSIIPHCITSNEGIAITRSLIEAYFARKYSDIYEYQKGNAIVENSISGFVDIPSSLTFPLPCNVNQNYFTTQISMNHAIILQYTNGGNGQICLDAGDTLSDAGVIGGDINGSCSTHDYNSSNDMQFTFDTFALLGKTYLPTSVTMPTPQPTTIQPSLSVLSIPCSNSCSCTGNRDCIISCGEEDCESGTLKCNAGYACTIYCDDEESCKNVNIEANGATSLDVICTGHSDTCSSASIDCASTVDGCTLDCTSGNSNICYNVDMTCGTGDCTIDCSGSGSSKCSSVDVDASVASSYDCSGNACSSSISVVTGNPTKSPTLKPTSSPTTFAPTKPPTIFLPTVQPTFNPSEIPSSIPSGIPSSDPTTAAPTTFQPTSNPTTIQPTFVPSSLPTRFPTDVPSESPTTVIPTATPTTSAPSIMPSVLPSISPTSAIPSLSPISIAPSYVPSNVPSSTPSSSPTHIPTHIPTYNPNTIRNDRDDSNDQPFMASNEYTLFSKENIMWFAIAASIAIFSLIFIAVVYLRRRRRKLYQQAMNIKTILRLRSTEEVQQSRMFSTPLSSMSHVSNTSKAFNNGLNTNSLPIGSYSNGLKNSMTNETNIYMGSSAVTANTPTVGTNTLSVVENFNTNVLSTAVMSNDMLMDDVLSSMQTAGGDNIIDDESSTDDEEFEVVSDIEVKTVKEDIFKQKFKLKSVGKYDRNGNIILLDNNTSNTTNISNVNGTFVFGMRNDQRFHPQPQKKLLKKNETIDGFIDNVIDENGAPDMDIDNIFIDVDGGMFVSDVGIHVQSDDNTVINNTTTDDFATKESFGNSAVDNENITAGGLVNDDDNVSESDSSDSSTDEEDILGLDECNSNGVMIGSDPQTKYETEDVDVEGNESNDVSNEDSDTELEVDDSSDDDVLQEMDTIC